MSIVELPRPRLRPITAAALNLADGVTSKQLIKQLRKHQAWQKDAVGYFSEIGEIHYVVNRAASALTEARLYAATRDPATGQLVPVDAPESLVTPAVADAANELLANFRAPVGGQQQLIHQAYVNAEIAGEFFLVETYDDNDASEWWIRSVLETEIRDAGQPIKIAGVGSVDFDQVSRIWRPHPMRFEAADSGMRPVLSACELVILIDRHFRAAMKSRLFAGLLLLSNGLRDGVADTSQRGDPKADKFVDDFVDALNAGIGDEASAAAITPNIVFGANDDIDHTKRVEFAQQVNPEVLNLRDSSITRIVQGLEYPPEVVTGTGDVSHWGAWFIGDSFIDHLRPKGDFLADAFTTVHLRPGLEAAGVDPAVADEVMYAFDYTPLARKPDIVETATRAWDRYVISDASLRRDLGYDDDDAPAPEEVAARADRRIAGRVTSDPTSSTTGPPAGGPENVTASARPNPVGEALSRIDVELVERLTGAAVTAARRAAEKAGNRAKSKVASAYRESVRDVPAHEICAQLGPTLLAAAGLTDDELLADSLVALERDYRRWTTDAAEAAYGLATGSNATEQARVEWEHKRQQALDTSWDWFANAYTTILAQSVADGAAPTDATIRTLVRQAVAIAGGVTEFTTLPIAAAYAVPVSCVQGIGTGQITLDMLDWGGYGMQAWRWVHDDPAHPFPPHVDLDGAEAATVDEFGISFDEWPGSHAGCLCVLEPLITEVVQ